MVMTPMALRLPGAGTVRDGYVSPGFNLESTPFRQRGRISVQVPEKDWEALRESRPTALVDEEAPAFARSTFNMITFSGERLG
jgi:hypothetical protein